MTNTTVVILAAGAGTRMKSGGAKVLFPILGRPMLHYVLDAASALSPDHIVPVVGHDGQSVRESVDSWVRDRSWQGRVTCAWQAEQLGTGHALMSAREALGTLSGDVIVLCGDVPMVTGELLQDFYGSHKDSGAHVSLVCFAPEDMGAYGRVVRGEGTSVQKIVEARDLGPEDKGVKEANAGMYIGDAAILFSLLQRLGTDNAKGEYYLTDVVGLAAGDGMKVSAFLAPDPDAVQGVNDRYALALCERRMRLGRTKGLCDAGVTIRDPFTTYIDWDVVISPDATIEPGTYLRGRTKIGALCVIGPGTEIVDSSVDEGSAVRFSVVEHSKVGKGVQIGPYTHIRPGSTIEDDAQIGNFAEVKNTIVGKGTKAHHHSYLGDSTIGSRVNIGAGTITVNYDGKEKHRTIIEDGAFIGCNANLVAPVTVGEGAYVACGSTVTSDVPPDSLAIARSRQTTKEGWVTRKRGSGG